MSTEHSLGRHPPNIEKASIGNGLLERAKNILGSLQTTISQRKSSTGPEAPSGTEPPDPEDDFIREIVEYISSGKGKLPIGVKVEGASLILPPKKIATTSSPAKTDS